MIDERTELQAGLYALEALPNTFHTPRVHRLEASGTVHRYASVETTHENERSLWPRFLKSEWWGLRSTQRGTVILAVGW